MDWQPNQESLKTLAVCLKDSLSGFDRAAQKQAEIVSCNENRSGGDGGGETDKSAPRRCCLKRKPTQTSTTT